MAAEAYYRLTNRLAVVNVTSGPGGTNAITGVYGAFVDSIGMLVISGQVKIETTVRTPACRCANMAIRNSTSSRSSGRSPNMRRWSPTRARSATIWKRRCIWRPAAGRGRSGSTSRSTCRRRRSIRDDLLPGFDPAELDEPWKRDRSGRRRSERSLTRLQRGGAAGGVRRRRRAAVAARMPSSSS